MRDAITSRIDSVYCFFFFLFFFFHAKKRRFHSADCVVFSFFFLFFFCDAILRFAFRWTAANATITIPANPATINTTRVHAHRTFQRPSRRSWDTHAASYWLGWLVISGTKARRSTDTLTVLLLPSVDGGWSRRSALTPGGKKLERVSGILGSGRKEERDGSVSCTASSSLKRSCEAEQKGLLPLWHFI